MKNAYLTIPNFITLSRILLIIPIFILIQNNLYTGAFTLTTLALCTDFLDGKVARLTNSASLAGSILDPLADKIFVFSLLFFFTTKNLLNPAYFAISFTRDALQLLAIPILLGYKKIKFNIKPKLLPKIATTLKYLIIMILFSISMMQLNLQIVLLPTLVLSAIIEIYIFFRYIIRFHEIYNGLHNTFE